MALNFFVNLHLQFMCYFVYLHLHLNHTYNENQIERFKAGSALNLIRQQNK